MLPSMNHTGRQPNAPRDVSLTCVFDLLYELVMIKVTACHPSKKKCKHSMKRTIPIRILLAYLMIISNPFEGTISFENSKCLHWLTHMKNEWEREIPSMHARLLSKGEPISSSSSNGLSSTDTGLNCSFCLFVHSCYDPYHVHLIIIIKKLLKIIHIASVSTRNATSHSSIPKKKKKKKKNHEQSFGYNSQAS